MPLASLHDRIRSWYRRRYRPAALNAWLINADGVCNGREKIALRPERGVRAGAPGNGSERDGAHLNADSLERESLTTSQRGPKKKGPAGYARGRWFALGSCSRLGTTQRLDTAYQARLWRNKPAAMKITECDAFAPCSTISYRQKSRNL